MGLLEAVEEGEELRGYKKRIKQEFEVEKDLDIPEVANINKFVKELEKYLDELHSIRDDKE